MKKLILTETHSVTNEKECLYKIDLSDIPDCNGKYDIVNKNGYAYVSSILAFRADMDSFNEIFLERRETENPKYNFIWDIIRQALKNDKTHEDITTPYKEVFIIGEIYPKSITYVFGYKDNSDIHRFTKSQEILLSVDQTVLLLKSGIFTDIVGNCRKE
jgi:hypothetical protein